MTTAPSVRCTNCGAWYDGFHVCTLGIQPVIPTGWKCPQCQQIHAPSVLSCPNCKPLVKWERWW